MKLLPILIFHVAISFATTKVTTALALLSQPSADDTLMHNWCDSIGIAINPSVQLLTTPQSVAGRGVFAIRPLVKDELAAAIPTYAMLHPENARSMFPGVAFSLQQKQREQLETLLQNVDESACLAEESGKDESNKKLNWFQTLKRRILRRKREKSKNSVDNDNVGNEEIPWQVELTEYALAALKGDHPMAPWIQQWKRDDPLQRLFQNGPPNLPHDSELVQATALELQQQVSGELPIHKIWAALNIRLEQYERFATQFVSNPQSPTTAAMYTTLTSRTIGVIGNVTGVVPFHDMINHDFEPNVGLGISEDGTHLEIFALDDVPAGEELFLSYCQQGRKYDEDAAVWMLIQWGIPVLKKDWKVQRRREIAEAAAV